MLGYIDNINFKELEVQKYWSFPASYSDERKRSETRNFIYGCDYLGSRKMDGAFAKFVKDEDGNMMMLGRSRSVSGDFLNKIGHVPHLHSFFESLPNGTCLLGELYFPNNEGSHNVTTVMGCAEAKAIARQEKGDKIYFYAFDVLAFEGKSCLKDYIQDRVALLQSLSTRFTSNSFVHWAVYYEGKTLWNKLQEILAEGGEGVVITKKSTCYQPEKRPARQTLKIKKELQDTIDAFVSGANAPTKVYTGKAIESWKFWENLNTGALLPEGEHYKDYHAGAAIIPVTKNYYYGWAGSLKLAIYKNGIRVRLGDISGLPQEVLSNWRDYIEKVCEITGMEITEDGAIRHPKFVKWRPDKNPTDCIWNEDK